MAVEESVFNSKKDMPFILRVTKKVYPIMERMFPSFSHNWAMQKFSTPFHFPAKSNEKEFIDTASKSTHSYKAQDVVIYEWNKEAEKTVLLSHGWSGRGGQFWSIIPALVKEGYHVMTFDALAHGESQGKQTHLWDFQKIIEQLSIKNNGFYYMIGHSLGGVACSLALNNRAKAKGVLTINSPTISKEMIEAFVTTINGSEKLINYFRKFIEENFNVTLEGYELLSVVPQLIKKGKRFSIVADKNDMDVPFHHSLKLKEKAPEVNEFFTEGFGHNKVLGNKDVINFIIEKLS